VGWNGEGDVRLEPHVASCVRVVEADPMLLRGVPSDAADRLRRRLVTELIVVPTRGLMPFTAAASSVLGLLILEGMLLRSVTVASRRTVELLGPGDVVRPWQDDGRFAVLPAPSAWTALEATRVAILDAEFATVAFHFPAIADELMRRLVDRCHALSERLAIASIPSLPERVLALLWHLAERWGRVEPDGVLLPLRLSHQLLAELACAQRPSVTVALKQLVAAGQAARSADGGWVLLGPMPDAEGAASAVATSPAS
jgi:CRP/FNR family cyclic AMP-dependent transcriptional regulator